MGCCRSLIDINKEYRILDWLIVFVLLIVGLILELLPFSDDFEECFRTDISEPLHSDTITYWIVFTGEFLVIPMLILLLVLFVVPSFSKNKVLCAYFCTIGINLSISNGLKRFVARPRPDTIAVCGGDGSYQRCKQVLSGLKLTHQFFSFPSEHASESMAALCFFSLFLSDVWTSKSIVILALRLFPISLSLLIGASRIWDRRHHTDDVVAGYIIGAVTAMFVYNVYKQKPKLG
jgi:diacylglycerol diphosphate phosphatase/phosphatidate phosphatase